MKKIIAALSLATLAASALAAQSQGANETGESDFAFKAHFESPENSYYRNQAGQEDKHQPQVGG